MKITPKRRPQWTEEELDAIFNKGKPSSIFSKSEYRVDDYGNLRPLKISKNRGR